MSLDRVTPLLDSRSSSEGTFYHVRPSIGEAAM